MPDPLIPLAPGTLLSSASKELEKQILDAVPAGKRGVALTVVDARGIRLGVAMAYKGAVTASFDIAKAWDASPPTASLKIKATF